MPFCNVFQRLPAEITRIILQFLVSDVDVHTEFEVGPLWQWEEMMEVLEARLVCTDWLGHLEELDIYNKMDMFRKCRIASWITTERILTSFKGCTRLERYSGIKDFFVKGVIFKRTSFEARKTFFTEPDYVMNIMNIKQLTGGDSIFVRSLFFLPILYDCSSPCRNKNNQLVLLRKANIPRKAKSKVRKCKRRRLQQRTRSLLRRQRTQRSKRSKRPKTRKYAYNR